MPKNVVEVLFLTLMIACAFAGGSITLLLEEPLDTGILW
jgi:hypothetical protein